MRFIVSFWGSRVFVWFFGSFLQVILSLAEFTNALEDDVKERLPKTLSRFVFHRILCCMLCGDVRDDDPLEIPRMEDGDAIVARGRILWNSIYEPHAVKLHDRLSSYHPDFMGEYTRTHTSAFFIPPLPSLFCPSFVRDRFGQQPRSTLHTALHLYASAPFHVRLSSANRRDGRKHVSTFELNSSITSLGKMWGTSK